MDILNDLPLQMMRVQDATSTASEAIGNRYFPKGNVPTWTGEAS